MATAKKAAEMRTYKVIEGRNFNGFMHPATRKFVTAKDGMIQVPADDTKAIAILTTAADVTDVTDIMK